MSITTFLKDLRSGRGMKARAIRGTLISLIGFGGGQVIRLGANLILTRLLFPEAFGLMALVQVLLSGLQMFSDTGLRPAVMQSGRGDDPDFLNTAWTVQSIRGLVLWVAAGALAWPAAAFYDQGQLLQILPILGATLAISGLNSTWIIQANRNMRLGPETVISLVSQIIGTLAMIALALWLRSVWALVIGTLIGASAKMILSHLVTGQPRNRICWDRPALSELFHFGKYIFVATIAGYFLNQGDRLILGKFTDLETLAMFTIAYALATLPGTLSSHLSERVLFPLFRSHPPAQSAENRRHIAKARGLLTGAFVAICFVMALGGEALIDLLYDPRYQAAGPLLVLLSLTFVPGLLTESYFQILLANGNSRNFTIATFISGALKIGLLLVLIQAYGVLGAVLVPAVVELLSFPLLIYFVRPYRGWYPLQDILFLTLWAGVGALAVWQSPQLQDLIATVLR